VLDRNGHFLYGLEDNNLTPEASRYRFTLNEEGWQRVTDDQGNELLVIETRTDNKGNYITYISGEFYDKSGKLAAKGDERGLLVNCPLRM
jgi:hypothetical protein